MRATGPRRDDGFTLIEVLVAIIFTTMVLVSTGAALVLSLSTESDMISRHRAQVIADDTINRMAAIPRDQLGFYADDNYTAVPGAITYLGQPRWKPPAAVSRQFTERLNYFYFPDTTRPTSGYVAMPPPVSTVSYDDSAKGGAKRDYTVYVMATTYNASVTNTYGEFVGGGSQRYRRLFAPDSVFAIVRWTEGGKDREVVVRKEMADTDPPACTFGAICADIRVAATGGTFPAGEYGANGQGTSNTFGHTAAIPVTVSGTTLRTAYPITYTAAFTPQNYYSSSFPAGVKATSVARIAVFRPAGGTTYLDMTPAGPNRWTYTVPAGTVVTPTASTTYFRIDTTAGSKSAWVIGNLEGYTSTNLEIRGVGTTGAALPGTAGTPTGSLRLNTADNTTLSGTVTPRFCTKADGSLWFNQKFYVDIAGADLQGWGGGTPGNGVVKYRVKGFTGASTLANRTPTYYTHDNFRVGNSAAWPTGSTYVGTISGSSAVGSLTGVYRYGLLFPTSAFATSKGFTHAEKYPKFFSSRVELEIYVERPYDNKSLTKIVSIPVYRSNTGTSTDCRTGTAAQPAY